MSGVHFIGVGGVGVAGVANVSADLGLTVTGSDSIESGMLLGLRHRGVDVWAPHREAVPTDTELVVYSSAIGEGNPELRDARRRGIRCIRRGEYLGELARRFERVVAVGGSHGKTSTTAMLAHICREAGLNPGYLVGGAVSGWERSATAGDGRILVTEVDESDGTQVFTHADIAVVTNVDDDHCWGHGGVAQLEQCFVSFMSNAASGLTWRSEKTSRLFGQMASVRILDGADMPSALRLPQAGEHWRVDGTLAVAAAGRLGVSREQALMALATFPGVERRMSVRGKTADGLGTVVEDYAHHPAELRATLQALGEMFGEHEMLVVFQPHRYERVKRYGAEFSEILGQCALCWVVAPFAAWLADGENVHPEDIARNIPGNRGVYVANDPAAIAGDVLAFGRTLGRPYVVAVIGAGDVNKVVPALLGK